MVLLLVHLSRKYYGLYALLEKQCRYCRCENYEPVDIVLIMIMNDFYTFILYVLADIVGIKKKMKQSAETRAPDARAGKSAFGIKARGCTLRSACLGAEECLPPRRVHSKHVHAQERELPRSVGFPSTCFLGARTQERAPSRPFYRQ